MRILIGFLCLLLGSTAFSSSVTQVARYSTVNNVASKAQINPLVAVVQVNFPESVKTVEQAIHYLLLPSGYALVPLKQLSKTAQTTMKKPLPVIDRHLGPLPLQDALVVVMGEQVFHLVQDPVSRQVSFQLKPEIKRALMSERGKNND